MLVCSWTESEWDDEQQGWMLALLEYRAGLCRGCGQPMRESLDEERNWVAPPPTRCHACDAIVLAQEKDKRHRPSALLWHAQMKR